MEITKVKAKNLPEFGERCPQGPAEKYGILRDLKVGDAMRLEFAPDTYESKTRAYRRATNASQTYGKKLNKTFSVRYTKTDPHCVYVIRKN